MNKLRFFLLQTKRTLKSIGLLCLFLLFLCGMVFLSIKRKNSVQQKISIGLLLQNDDALSVSLYERLCNLDDSVFLFVPVFSEEELQKRVMNKSLECGYQLSKPLKKLLDDHIKANLITIYTSESTTCSGIINELIYSSLFEEYALHLAEQFIEEDDFLPLTKEKANDFALPRVTERQIKDIYTSYLYEGGTFRFEIRTNNEEKHENEMTTSSTTANLFYGFSAIFLFLCGYLSLFTLKTDEENGLLLRFQGRTRFLAKLITMSAVLFPSMLVCYAALLLAGEITRPFYELFALFCYSLLLLVFFYLLNCTIKNKTVLTGMFPVLLLCSILFTGVFVDLSGMLPLIRGVRYLFPPFYYMQMIS